MTNAFTEKQDQAKREKLLADCQALIAAGKRAEDVAAQVERQYNLRFKPA